jgi:hypothetical protein
LQNCKPDASRQLPEAQKAPSMMKEFCLFFFQKVRIRKQNASTKSHLLVTRNIA